MTKSPPPSLVHSLGIMFEEAAQQISREIGKLSGSKCSKDSAEGTGIYSRLNPIVKSAGAGEILDGRRRILFQGPYALENDISEIGIFDTIVSFRVEDVSVGANQWRVDANAKAIFNHLKGEQTTNQRLDACLDEVRKLFR